MADRKPLTEEEILAAKKAHAEYQRKYRKAHPEKTREDNIRYWAKRAAKEKGNEPRE